jgi:predicted SnoaL-like aldol condensation-catalyzing enzyme
LINRTLSFTTLFFLALLISLFNSILVYGQDNNKTNITGIKQDNASLTIPDNEVSKDGSQKENKNENIVREFIKNVFDSKNASAAADYIVENYIQHNPFIPTGREAFINFFTKFFSLNPDSSQEIKRIYTDGDYVLVHHSSQSNNTNNTESAIIDIYRLNNSGKIVEHWDVIQQIPPSSANNNTMFYRN